MSLIEPLRPARLPAAPLDMVIGLHPDDVDAPAFVPAHLREMEEERPAETTTETEILTETEPSTASPEEVHPADLVEAPVVEAESSSTDDAGDGRKARRKKNRRKRRRKKADAARIVSTNSDGADSPAETTSADTPALPDGAFGTGLDS